jgi:hypothetical protein
VKLSSWLRQNSPNPVVVGRNRSYLSSLSVDSCLSCAYIFSQLIYSSIVRGHYPLTFLTNIISPRTAKTIPANGHSPDKTSPTITPHHIAGGNMIQPAIAAFIIVIVDRPIINPNPKTQSAHRSHMFSLFIPSIVTVLIK